MSALIRASPSSCAVSPRAAKSKSQNWQAPRALAEVRALEEGRERLGGVVESRHALVDVVVVGRARVVQQPDDNWHGRVRESAQRCREGFESRQGKASTKPTFVGLCLAPLPAHGD